MPCHVARIGTGLTSGELRKKLIILLNFAGLVDASSSVLLRMEAAVRATDSDCGDERRKKGFRAMIT